MGKFLKSNLYWTICLAFALTEFGYLADLGASMWEKYAHFDGEIRTLVYIQLSTALVFLGFGVVGICANMLGGIRSRWKPQWIFSLSLTAFPIVLGSGLVIFRAIGISDR